MTSKLKLLIALLVFSHTHAKQRICYLDRETCGVTPEFNEYTFTDFVSETYESVQKYLGVWKERSVGDDDADAAYEDAYDDEGDDANDVNDANSLYDNDDINEEKLDDMVERAQNLAAMMMDGSQDFDTMNHLSEMFKDAMKFEEVEDIVDEGDPNGNGFEYPPMHKIDPGTVGQVRSLELPDGRKTTMKTLAKQPVLFEIENFLTEEEADLVLEASKKEGPIHSGVFKSAVEMDKDDTNLEVRNSKSATLKPPVINEELLKRIHDRISSITEIPAYVIEGSEPLSIGYYETGGYYKAHLDSNENSRKKVPCCFQSFCTDPEGRQHVGHDCCTICRYATFLYYLTDVEGGGETAFPFADLTMSEILRKREDNPEWENLTKFCHDASVVVKPAKGKAIFWYNHLLDGKGYLGGVDKRSYHGGCNVTSGAKWIATNWISTPIYEHRFKPSQYKDITESFKQQSGI